MNKFMDNIKAAAIRFEKAYAECLRVYGEALLKSANCNIA